MATFLVTASVGDQDLTEYTTDGGLPMLDAVGRDLARAPTMHWRAKARSSSS